jgi:uncharacterized membrane protein SpoIIM required for sporulation
MHQGQRGNPHDATDDACKNKKESIVNPIVKYLMNFSELAFLARIGILCLCIISRFVIFFNGI